MNETRVLLVDDEEEFVTALAERLRLRGIGVETAANGARALEMAGARVFDAVLLDMAMPGLDGVQTLKSLLRINPDQQVVVLTGRATLGQAVEAMKLGALDLLEKPVEILTLVARIEEAALRRSHLEDQRIDRQVKDITRSRGW